MKQDTYLPIFPGFYGSIFESDEENSIEEGKEYDDYEWENKDYEERVATACCQAIEEQLTEFNIKVNYQATSSPKYYNFSNDSINIEIEITPENYDKLINYLEDHKEAFEDYLKDNYTMRDGFMPSHSSNPKSWILPLNTMEKPEHKLGAILEFYLLNEDYTIDDLIMEDAVCSETSWIHGKLIEK